MNQYVIHRDLGLAKRVKSRHHRCGASVTADRHQRLGAVRVLKELRAEALAPGGHRHHHVLGNPRLAGALQGMVE